MKIKNKINFSFVIAFVLILGGVMYFVFSATAEQLEKEVGDRLETTAFVQGNQILFHLNEHKEDAKIFSQLESFEDLLNTDAKSGQYLEKRENVQKKLTVINEEHVGYLETFLLDKNGVVRASSNRNQIGINKSEESYFSEIVDGKKKFFVGIPEKTDEFNKIVLNFSSPIVHDQSNEFLGAIVFITDWEDIYKSLIQQEDTEKGGQSYLIDNNLNLISPDLYEGEILKEKIDTINSRNCFLGYERKEKNNFRLYDINSFRNIHLEGGHKSVEKFSNYQGITVLGAHLFIQEANWCLLTEVEEQKALTGAQKIILYFGGVSVAAIVFYLAISVLISRLVIMPIEKLQKRAKMIENGKLNYKARVNSNDEIGELSRSFDKMVSGIKKAREEVDEKVKEQTKEIKEKAKYLEEQRKAILNVLQDIEDEKNKTEREKEKTDAILQSIGDAVFVVDKKMNIVLFNKVAEKISGFTAKEAIGKNYKKILKFVFEKNGKSNDEFIEKAIKTGKIKEMANHTLLISKDGKRIPVADSASPLKSQNGDVEGCVIVFRDVTKEREVDKAKTEFVSLASHQLRTPLSSINWYSEMLLNGDAGKINKEQKDFLKEIYKGNQRMVDLVNALLNVSRIELGTLAIDPEMIDFNDIAKSVIKEMEPLLKKKEQKINKNLDEELPQIPADPKLVRIIFQNLISNAIKYTPKKGSISMETKKEKDSILIKVSDNGYGIPKKQQSKIFGKLFRADNIKDKDAEGTGLGLYMIKAIVEQGNGNIWFESEKDKGTTFYVQFPLTGMKKKRGNKGLNEIK